MGRKPTGKPTGRPKIKVVPATDIRDKSKEVPPKEIKLDQVLYWIEYLATAEEIAGSFRVSVNTLYRAIKEAYGMTFEELKKRCHGEHKLCLRRYQYKQAEKSATMAIWLGKIWLGQKEDNKAELKYEILMDLLKAGDSKGVQDFISQ
jgi:AraC-like DNA-binding protein